MAESPKHVYLIDGSGFIFRAFHALPQMTRSDGTPINAVMGFCNMILKLIDSTDADRIACILDYSSKTFRNEIYDQYKAHRPDPPEELVPQFPMIREAARAFNLPVIEMEGYEADDIIATYTRMAREAGAQVTIVSSDKDLMQLIDDGVVMLDGLKNKEIRAEQVMEKFGVAPNRVIDVQAISGDSIDNVPGVKGIGEKVASQVVANIGSLDQIYAGVDKDREKFVQPFKDELEAITKQLNGIYQERRPLNSEKKEIFKLNSDKQVAVIFQQDVDPDAIQPPKVNTEILERLSSGGNELATTLLRARFLSKFLNTYLEKIEDAREIALMSKKLVTLDRHVPLKDGLDELINKPPEPDALLGFLRAQEFRTITARVEGWFGDKAVSDATRVEATPSDTHSDGYELVQEMADLERWIAESARLGVVAVDTETTSLDEMRAELVGISMSTAAGNGCYIPVGHRQSDAFSEVPKQLDREVVLTALKPLLTDPAVLKIGHNIKYDMVVLSRYGIDVAPTDDTMLLSYVLEGGKHDHKMDSLAQLYLGITPIPFKDVAGSGKSQITFDEVPLDRARDYAAEDADVTLRLWQDLKPRLPLEKVTRVYETIERPLIPVIAEMEKAGVKVDRVELERMSGEFAIRIQDLEKEIHKLAGHPFTIGSPKQLGDVLFGEMGLEGGKKGKSGAYTTSADVLEAFAAQGHELPVKVLEWRQLSKLKSTYTDTLVDQINPDTGRVHTSFSMAAASTGRLASSDPNLQNIPIRTEEGRRIRDAFVAEKGHVLLSADYSQIELRLLAHVADIPTLKEAFRDGLDIHAMTASQVFGVPLKDMDPITRRNAKAINFGIIYGISAFGLARQLAIGRDEAAAYIKAYFERYPGIKDYMERTKKKAKEVGYVETLFGRRCYVPGINDRNPSTRGFYERAAINAPLQGSAADIIKRAMIRVPGALEAAKLKGRMLLQVHDELLFEVPEGEADKTAKLAKQVMEDAAHLSVPLTVDTGTGLNWNAAH